jgi:hypothetical protein
MQVGRAENLSGHPSLSAHGLRAEWSNHTDVDPAPAAPSPRARFGSSLSRRRVGRGGLLFEVDGQLAEDDVGELSFEAAQRFFAGLARASLRS